jgi:fucose permease
VVVQRYRERAARPMLAVHSAATIGAMLAPPLIGWIASAHHFTASFHAAGWAHVAIAAGPRACRCRAEPRDRDSATVTGASRSRWRRCVPLAAVAFAYVGVEASVTMFAVPYASGALGSPRRAASWRSARSGSGCWRPARPARRARRSTRACVAAGASRGA